MNTVSRPLARAQPSGAACPSLPSTGHNSPDPIALHMQAGTQLPEPLHGCALQDLAAAQQAIAALQSIDLPLVGGKPCKPPKNTLPPWQHRPSHVQNLPPCVLRPLGTVQTRTVG